jgi:hypothetical protein
MIARKLGGLIALVLGGLLTNFASAGSDSDTARSSLSLTYLQMLPDESVKSLSGWCAAHIGEPVSSNPVIDVPNYVSCDEVNLEQLSRTVENTPPITCEELKSNPDADLEGLREFGLKC